MVQLINNLISFIMFYHVFIPKNTLLYSKGCFLLLLLKTKICTMYTVNVVSFKIPVQYYLKVLILNGMITLVNLVYATGRLFKTYYV